MDEDLGLHPLNEDGDVEAGQRNPCRRRAR